MVFLLGVAHARVCVNIRIGFVDTRGGARALGSLLLDAAQTHRHTHACRAAAAAVFVFVGILTRREKHKHRVSVTFER